MTIDLGHPPVAQVAEGAADGARVEAKVIVARATRPYDGSIREIAVAA